MSCCQRYPGYACRISTHSIGWRAEKSSSKSWKSGCVASRLLPRSEGAFIHKCTCLYRYAANACPHTRTVLVTDVGAANYAKWTPTSKRSAATSRRPHRYAAASRRPGSIILSMPIAGMLQTCMFESLCRLKNQIQADNATQLNNLFVIIMQSQHTASKSVIGNGENQTAP